MLHYRSGSKKTSVSDCLSDWSPLPDVAQKATTKPIPRKTAIIRFVHVSFIDHRRDCRNFSPLTSEAVPARTRRGVGSPEVTFELGISYLLDGGQIFEEILIRIELNVSRTVWIQIVR